MAFIVVGVGGGIAAYKVAEVVRGFVRAGHSVHVVPTPSSLTFVGAQTWSALSGHPVHTGVFETGVADHVELARHADLIVVAPTTVDLLARISAGMADDLLTTTIVASSCPVVLAPAMHSAMWTNPATQANVATLKARGLHIIDPAVGALASGDSGVGRLPDPHIIVDQALAFISRKQPLSGTRVLVSAGGTREPIDPVRFLGNRSSGRMGAAIAQAAQEFGAEVTLVSANVDKALIPASLTVVEASSAAEVETAVLERLTEVDVVIMAAAIADFRPISAAEHKIKKDQDPLHVPTITLERTRDILRAITDSPNRPAMVIGFAAETGTPDQVLAFGRQKAQRKGADWLVVNTVGTQIGFGDVDTRVFLLNQHGTQIGECAGTKQQVAHYLVGNLASHMDTIQS